MCADCHSAHTMSFRAERGIFPPSQSVRGQGGCSAVVELGWTGFLKDWEGLGVCTDCHSAHTMSFRAERGIYPFAARKGALHNPVIPTKVGIHFG